MPLTTNRKVSNFISVPLQRARFHFPKKSDNEKENKNAHANDNLHAQTLLDETTSALDHIRDAGVECTRDSQCVRDAEIDRTENGKITTGSIPRLRIADAECAVNALPVGAEIVYGLRMSIVTIPAQKLIDLYF